MSRGTDIAAKTLGTAAAAANAVPVWGQFASIGLGIASGLTKLFGNIDGPRKRKARERAAAQAAAQQGKYGGMNAQQQAPGAGGQQNTGQVAPPQIVAPQPMAVAPVFTGQQPQQLPPQGTTFNG